jgi:hypothetical protein
VAALFGDEIALRGRSLRADAAKPTDMLRLMIGHAGPGLSGLPRLQSVITTVATGRKGVEYNFRTACEVADALAARLGLDPAARTALATSFERWNGRGVPNGIAGTSIDPPRDVNRAARPGVRGPRQARRRHAALEITRARRGRAYDPELTDLLSTAAQAGALTSRPSTRGTPRCTPRRRSPRSTNTPCATAHHSAWAFAENTGVNVETPGATSEDAIDSAA